VDGKGLNPCSDWEKIFGRGGDCEHRGFKANGGWKKRILEGKHGPGRESTEASRVETMPGERLVGEEKGTGGESSENPVVHQPRIWRGRGTPGKQLARHDTEDSQGPVGGEGNKRR